MYPNSYFRVAACCPAVSPGNVGFNIESILSLWREMDEHGVDVAVFPELCVTGYTCGDLFQSEVLLDASLRALDVLAGHSKALSTAAIVGSPLNAGDTLFNAAFLIYNGEKYLICGKRNIPNYDEFYERRWFEPWSENLKIFNINGIRIAAEICEDLWVPSSPSNELFRGGAEVIFNLSASDDVVGKYPYLRNLICSRSGQGIGGYVYASAGFGESSTDLVFNGKAMIAENGKILSSYDPWHTSPGYVISDIDIAALRHDRRKSGYFGNNESVIDEVIIPVKQYHERDVFSIERNITRTPFVPSGNKDRKERCDEITNIQAYGLARRLEFTSCKSLVIGVSGGLDSTLALLVACKSFDLTGIDRSGIMAVTMPGFGTTERTKNNAEKLCEGLGVTFKTIPIGKSVSQHFEDIGHDASVKDVTYENSQARMRTMILMDLANKTGGMVLGTGDLSELALGWATYNGDHISMYGVNSGVPKTLVRYLVESFVADPLYVNVKEILLDIIATPVSPELLPPNDDGSIAQQTENLVGPYELHDFYLYYTLRYGCGPKKIFPLAVKAFGNSYDYATILKWMKIFYRRFFSQQFKRSCMPDGPKVGSVCLSPRGDWRMPSDASSKLWLTDVEELIEKFGDS